ncbi:NAD-dependent epimerase/dehydratase family protein [Ruminococcus sp.]|uniref:NAD-dependent epimerase/dehydratase family protein n=1 Tax=Ruminococcus sp. TaxID=41978 RepID=UPI00389107A7
MQVYEHPLYLEEVKLLSEYPLPWEKLCNSSVLITGGTGLIGSFLIDVLMYRNRNCQMNCKIHMICRNTEKAKKRFSPASDLISIIGMDINQNTTLLEDNHIDYIIHLASNTHPKAYAQDPIGTILTNVIGTKNMLDLGVNKQVKRCLFCSSVEIYGENNGDCETFDENYCGYINCNTLRAGYPESKRCGEALCQAYIKQEKLDIVIARLARIYGANLNKGDTKAISQFLNNAIEGQNIVLKSKGEQYYSFLYVFDAVSGILKVLLSGTNGEAYNISDENSDIRLKDLALMIAQKTDKKVIFQLPDKVEAAGFSKATLARMDNSKIRELGWEPRYDIKEGIVRTINILRECEK